MRGDIPALVIKKIHDAINSGAAEIVLTREEAVTLLWGIGDLLHGMDKPVGPRMVKPTRRPKDV